MASVYAMQRQPSVVAEDDVCVDTHHRLSSAMVQSIHSSVGAVSSATFYGQYARQLVSEMLLGSYEHEIPSNRAMISDMVGISQHHFGKAMKRRADRSSLIRNGHVQPPMRQLRRDRIAAGDVKVRMLFLFFEATCIPSPVKSKCVSVSETVVDEDGNEEIILISQPLHYTPFKSKNTQWKAYVTWLSALVTNNACFPAWFDVLSSQHRTPLGFTKFKELYPPWVRRKRVEECVCHYCDNIMEMLRSMPKFIADSHSSLLRASSDARKNEPGKSLLSNHPAPLSVHRGKSCDKLSCVLEKTQMTGVATIRSSFLQRYAGIPIHDIVQRTVCPTSSSLFADFSPVANNTSVVPDRTKCLFEIPSLAKASATRRYDIFKDVVSQRVSCGECGFLKAFGSQCVGESDDMFVFNRYEHVNTGKVIWSKTKDANGNKMPELDSDGFPKFQKNWRCQRQIGKTRAQYLQVLNIEISRWLRHSFETNWQNDKISYLKSNVKPGEVLCLIDYAGNLCLYGISHGGTVRNQAEYFLPAQVSILGLVVYYYDDSSTLVGEFHPVISEDLRHTYFTVDAALVEVLQNVQQRCKTPPTKIRMVSDGCRAQFKSVNAFAGIAAVARYLKGVSIEWFFHTSCHGKDLYDALLAHLKWWIATKIEGGAAISNAASLWNTVSSEFPTYFQRIVNASQHRKMPMTRCIPHFLNDAQHTQWMFSVEYEPLSKVASAPVIGDMHYFR